MQTHKKLSPNKEGFTREKPVLLQGFIRKKIDIILGLGCEKRVAPPVKAAAHLVPLITHIKRVLTIPALRLAYDHCGLTGLQRLLNHKLRCIHCMPVEDTGRPLRQGPVEYPQLHLLLKYSP